MTRRIGINLQRVVISAGLLLTGIMVLHPPWNASAVRTTTTIIRGVRMAPLTDVDTSHWDLPWAAVYSPPRLKPNETTLYSPDVRAGDTAAIRNVIQEIHARESRYQLPNELRRDELRRADTRADAGGGTITQSRYTVAFRVDVQTLLLYVSALWFFTLGIYALVASAPTFSLKSSTPRLEPAILEALESEAGVVQGQIVAQPNAASSAPATTASTAHRPPLIIPSKTRRGAKVAGILLVLVHISLITPADPAFDAQLTAQAGAAVGILASVLTTRLRGRNLSWHWLWIGGLCGSAVVLYADYLLSSSFSERSFGFAAGLVLTYGLLFSTCITLLYEGFRQRH